MQQPRWCVIVPVSPESRAKTRLNSTGARSELARAFAIDVVAAAAGSPEVGLVVVASPEQLPGAPLGSLWLDTGASDLNESILAAESLAHRLGYARLAVLVSDVAATRSDDITVALRAARTTGRAYVRDRHGAGTTLLTTTGGALDPRFGEQSARRHRATGALALSAHTRLRLDLDTARDIAVASIYGFGSATTAVLRRLRPGALVAD